MGRFLLVAGLTVVAAMLVFGCADDDGDGDGHATAEQAAQGEQAAPAEPNLVVVMTDDQTFSAFNDEAMPFTSRFFRRSGSVFANALSVPPLCCPARAGFLTGQYAHNHGVLANVPGYSDLRRKRSTLPAWLRHAGYRTGVVGKFMNGFPGTALAGPPGWDHWFIAVGAVDYFDFEVTTAGELRRFEDGEYATDIYTAEASRFVRRAAREENPFFLWLSYNAPHIVEGAPGPCAGRGPEPANRRDYERFADAALPRPPQFDEEDVGDKGPWVQAQPRISLRRLDELTELWRCTLASLRAVDRGFRSLVGTLRGLDLLDETVVVFVSDNGYFFGEHRIRDNKRLPYDPALRVPLAIHAPGDPPAGAGDEIEELVSTVDLAPTLLDYAGARPCLERGRCRVMDGRSLRPLLSGEAESWPSDRAIPIELADSINYRALRTLDHLYVELDSDYRRTLPRPRIELYDLQADPAQLRNVWREDRSAALPLRADLARRLRTLSGCVGTRPGNARACE
jgi:N-acetylglucosamine-6-sulfatase